MDSIKLYGRIFLTMDIKAVTGLRIGGSPAALAVGGLDNPVIRDPITQQPYIPGSSLRGKLRSSWEKHEGAAQNFPIRRNPPKVRIHMPTTEKQQNGESDEAFEERMLAYKQEIEKDSVCRIFGVTGDIDVPNPTRLVVHDTFLSEESVQKLNQTDTDQPFTETKWEAVIDRITSAAVPRQMERVPAGAVFSDCRLVYNVFGTMDGSLTDVEWFFDLIPMLQLVQDDYIGSSGSRGSGRIRFQKLRLGLRTTVDYMKHIDLASYNDLDSLWDNIQPLHSNIMENLGSE